MREEREGVSSATSEGEVVESWDGWRSCERRRVLDSAAGMEIGGV